MTEKHSFGKIFISYFSTQPSREKIILWKKEAVILEFENIVLYSYSPFLGDGLTLTLPYILEIVAELKP